MQLSQMSQGGLRGIAQFRWYADGLPTGKIATFATLAGKETVPDRADGRFVANVACVRVFTEIAF